MNDPRHTPEILPVEKLSSKYITNENPSTRVNLEERINPVKITASIVEDDAEARQILCNWLKQSEDFTLISDFGNAEAALAQIPKDKPAVVLMDINLPGMSGVECVTRLKPLMPGTQFVMLTVYEDSDHIFAALKAGASGYLLKETPRQDLLESLKDVFNGGSPMTSNIARKVVQSFQAPKPVADPSEELSPREREVLDLVTRGYLFKEIADKLNIGIPTVNTYIRRIYEKLHVRSRSQAVAKVSRFAQPEDRLR